MSIRDQYTDEEWKMLTKEEQAGLLSDDEEGDGEGDGEPEIDEAAAQAKAKEDADAQAATDKKAADDAAAEPEKKATPAGEPEKEEEQEEKPVITPRPRGVLNDTLPEDYKERVTANETAMDELAQKYEDGDISFAEYNKGMRKLNETAMDLRELKMRAEISDTSTSNALQERWDAAMGTFLEAHPEAISTPVRQNAFDQILREITAPVMQAGGMPGRAEIDKAYKRLAEEFGFAATTTTTEPVKGKKENKVPPTLGAVPAAAQNDVDDGKWAHLDRLAESDPAAYEAAMLKMSDAEREEYSKYA